MREFSNEELSHLLVNKVKELKESKCQTEELNARLQDTVAKLEETQQELMAQKEQLEEEIRTKTKDLIKTEKLATIGELAGRIAHDLRNPLSVIKNTSEIIKMNLAENLDKKTREQWGRLDRAIYRMQHQLEDVLDYIRQSPLQKSRTKLSIIISDAIERITAPDNVVIHPSRVDREVYCDPTKLEVVFVNLFINAIQALDNKPGTVDVIVSDDPQNKDFVIIKVKDSGPGIPTDLRSKIFDPLFTTRQIGTGLGLPSCKNIIEQHGGTIEFETKIGHGTTFSIKLPKNSEWQILRTKSEDEKFDNLFYNEQIPKRKVSPL